MRNVVIVVLAVCVGVVMFGCGKKQAQEEGQEVISMETLSTTGIPAVQAPEAKPQVAVSAPVAAGLEPLPPPGTGKPSVVEIQKALKNAGYYNGPIDGKIGSMTNSAIKEFQQANGLEVDGKVGPKTWAVLGAYLAAQLREQAGQ